MPKITWTPEIVPNGGVDESRSPTQIEDNAWTAASNVEPLPDGVRQRPGYIASNTVALPSILHSNETGSTDRTFTDTSSEYISQKFTVGGTNLVVRQVAVRLKLNDPADAPVAPDLAAAIYDDDGGSPSEPSTVVTDADFTDFSEVDTDDVTGEYKWYYFTGATAELTASTAYHLVIRYTGAAAGDTIDIEEDTTGTNEVFESTDASTWSVAASARLNYRVYLVTDAAITGVFDYRLSDATTARHLVYHGSNLYKNVAGTMTALAETPLAAQTSDNDLYPSFAVGQDKCFVAHGTDTPRKFYVLNTTDEHYENTGIAPPTTVPTATAAANTAAVMAGTWAIDYYYWNADTGQPSNRKYQGISTDAISVVVATDEQIVITGLPTTVARDGDRATHIRIEIKESVADSIFRFAGTAEGQVALGTTTATITTDTTTLPGEYFHTVPPSHTMNVVAENRQFIAGDPNFPYRVWYSSIANLTAYYESFYSLAYRDFGKGDGDYITALAFIPPRHILVGFKNSLWAFDARNPGASDAIKLADNIGVAHHNAYTVVGRRFYFVSDSETTKGLFVWPGSGEPLPLVSIDDTFKGLEQTRIKYANCAHLAPGDNRFQWWTLLSTSSASEHNYVIIYDYVLAAFSFYTYTENPCVLGNIQQDAVTTIFFGTYDGYEREADEGTQDLNATTKAAENFSSNATLKAFDYGSQEILKKFRFLDYLASGKTSGSIGFTLTPDFGTQPSASTNLDHLSSADVIILGTTKLSSSATFGSLDSNIMGRVGLRAFGKYFQPGFSAENDWHIKTFSMGIQPTGRRK